MQQIVLIFRFVMCAGTVLLLGNHATAAETADLSQGAYIARLGDCTSCHTAPGGKNFAGGLPVNSPVGVIYSSNITPDRQYGIGNYSLEDFSRALRKGIAKDGHHLYPAMPYTSFAGASDEDIKALYTYFMEEVAPVNEQPPQTKLIFPFNQRWGMSLWNAFFLPSNVFKTQTNRDASWNRGEYLATTWAHCGACHTPRGPAYEERGGPRSSLYLTGMTLDHWYAPNLRQNTVLGLGKWREDDIAQFLKSGHEDGVAAFGNMAQVVENSTQYLSDDDRQALAHYLVSLADEHHEISKPAVTVTGGNEHPGAGLYANYCASCHQADGAGRPPRIPKLGGNPAVMSPDPTSLIRIVLAGGRAAQTDDGPPPAKMPAFAGRFTDQEVADVVTFIRQSWGNYGEAATAGEVAVIRKIIAKPPVTQEAKPAIPAL